jgi:hypothetical protein
MGRTSWSLLAAVATAASLLATAAPASAAGDSDTTHVITLDPTGAVFTCPSASYTVLGGSVRFIFHDSIAADGSEHMTSKRVPIGVTLTDSTTSTIYRLAGGNSAEGNISIVNGTFEFTDVTFFNIVAPDGGIVGKVAGVLHVTSGVRDFSFTFGQCQTPQE